MKNPGARPGSSLSSERGRSEIALDADAGHELVIDLDGFEDNRGVGRAEWHERAGRVVDRPDRGVLVKVSDAAFVDDVGVVDRLKADIEVLHGRPDVVRADRKLVIVP